MSKTLYAAALAALTFAEEKVQYPDNVDVELIRVDNMDYQMAFKWPEEGHRCGATMITPQIALTAAHCIQEEEDGLDPGLTVKLADGGVYGIKEIRTNECWDFLWKEPYSADIAMFILDRPIPDAVQGVHYVKTWNAENMGDVVDKEFILAGWGISGEVREDGSDNHFTQGMDIFHRGYNVFNEIRDNVLVYTMDKPEDGGLELEVAGYYGDSGSGGFVVLEDELHIAGVLSHGEGAFWGAEHGYTRVGGYHTAWIEANVASLEQRVESTVCREGDEHGVTDQCRDTNIAEDGSILVDLNDNGCDQYVRNQHWCGQYDIVDFTSTTMCCACSGGIREEDADEEGDEQDEEESEEEEEVIDDVITITCPCECDVLDLTCWEVCYECLFDFFGEE